MTDSHQILTNAPYIVRIGHLALALALGLFVGLERQRQHKQAGLRTFGFVALLGGIGAVLGTPFAVVSLVLVGLLVTFITAEMLVQSKSIELTTSAALLVTAFVGVLCGYGHTLTPASVAVATAALLAWKKELAGFTLGLSDSEVRSAILFAILAFVIYPILPNRSFGPDQLIEPRVAWLTVILVAGIGFVNYVLWKIYGARGALLTGFLGGLVNSTVTVTELIRRNTENKGRLNNETYKGVLLATAAMAVRNGVIIAVIAVLALRSALIPLLSIAGVSILFAMSQQHKKLDSSNVPQIRNLSAPFSFRSALRFGVIFLALQIVGGLAEQHFGHSGFFVVSVIGGCISSASAVASAAALAAHHTLTVHLAGLGAAMASTASVFINIPIVLRLSKDRALTRRLTLALLVPFLVSGAIVFALV